VAAAIDASLDAPASSATIRDALYRSFGAPAVPMKKRPARPRLARTALAPALRLAPRDITEALILGEILLERRHR
jgi:hypothetical protein